MDAAAEVKSRLNIEDVAKRYIELRPAGRNFRALCPFHHEKTPSFMISPERGIYHCFGCSEGGDLFSFVMKMEGLDFRGALEKLAREVGVDIEDRRSGPSTQQKDRLYKALDAAAQFYQVELGKSQIAQEYVVQKRGFRKQIIIDFRIGYAPNSPDALGAHLQKKGFGREELQKTGLSVMRGGRPVDMFRGRMMVPLSDAQGRVVGFTARLLDPPLTGTERGPKYINSQQTILYDKSRLVFGWPQANESIRKTEEAVVVEGNLDVISSHQAGVKNVVAVSGTAMSPQHLSIIKRLTPTVKLAFDIDEAGLRATERGIGIAQKAGVNLFVVTLPEGKDPDELIRNDPKKWQKAIDDAEYVLDWLLARLLSTHKPDTAIGKKQISDRFLETLGQLSDPVEQDHYADKLAQQLDISKRAVIQKLGKKEVVAENKRAAVQVTPTKRGQSTVAADALLSLATRYPDTRVSLQELKDEHFDGEDQITIVNFLRSNGEDTLDEVPDELRHLENYVKILLLKGETAYGDWNATDRRIEGFSLAKRLENLHVKGEKRELTQKIREAEAAGDASLAQKLLQQYQDTK